MLKMKYKNFKNVIESLEKVTDRSHKLYQLGVNLIDYDDMYHNIITNLLNSIFDKDGKDWIDWYLYERIGFTDKVNLATDADGKEICYDIPSLWKVVKNNLLVK
jgi:uncharacterized protein Yka (UPF0111/DUF47 family)